MRSRTLGPLLHSMYRFCAHQGGDCRTDADLLQRFTQTHDQEAFAALVHRHGPMVLAVCQRLLPDRHEAEDAFQATFLVLVRKSAVLRRPQQLAPWLHGVAQRIALRLRHRAARWQALPEGLEPVEAEGPEPLDRLAWQEVRTILDEEIDRLPSKYRLPVVLCYLQGQSYAEAARSLGWPAGTVSVRLARARQKLRDRFVRRGLGLSASLLGTLLGKEALASPVPAALFTATVNAGVCGAAGASALAGVVTQQVITLAEGVLHTMWMTKCKAIVFLVLVTGLAWSGLSGLAWQQGPRAQAQVPVVGGAGEGERDLGKDLDELEKQLKALQKQVQEKQRQMARLRHGDALDQIEAALKKLKQAHAGEPQGRIAIAAFEQAFGKLKQGLAGKANLADWIQGSRLPNDSYWTELTIYSNGRVLQVDLEKKQVLLSMGTKEGVKKGQLYRVYQSGKANPDQTGWIRITQVESKWSIGTILQLSNPQGAPMQPNDIIQRHDGKEPKGLEGKSGEGTSHRSPEQ